MEASRVFGQLAGWSMEGVAIVRGLLSHPRPISVDNRYVHGHQRAPARLGKDLFSKTSGVLKGACSI